MGDVMKSSAKAQDAQERAQVLAMAALEHGHRITQKQRDLVNKLTPDRKKRLETIAREVSVCSDYIYREVGVC